MYKVVLKHARNPDVCGGYWSIAHREPRRDVVVETLNDAAREVRSYIERNDLGGGNWTGGQVFDGREQVARVSYNGRVWLMNGDEAT